MKKSFLNSMDTTFLWGKKATPSITRWFTIPQTWENGKQMFLKTAKK
jgi:hypothetical protein